jgi:hypothetical protein
MLSHRTTARGASLLIVAAFCAAAALASPARSAKGVPTIVFPLIGDMDFADNYGDARANGSHAGIDIMAPRRTPVVAAEDGKVKWWTSSARAGCMLYLYGKSGTTYLYIHLNNDRTLGNDNRGACADVAFTVPDGARVTAGQQIALNGDSGDADGNPHLHFEVHPNDGADVNPMPYLRQATHILFPAKLGSKFSLALKGTPVAAGAGRVTLRANAVRWWPGGRWTPIASRLVEIGVKKGAAIDTALAAAVIGATTRELSSKQAQPFTVYTEPARVTVEALRGEPGALLAARIARPGGKLVAVDATPAKKPGKDAAKDTGGPGDDPDGEWTPPWEQTDPDADDGEWTPPWTG